MSVLRPDLEIISHWIRPATRVLDLGCGDGTLLRHLQDTRQVTGYGLEIDPDNVVRSLQAGIQVIQMDVDQGLTPFADQSFDYVILTQALQVVRYPEQLLREMLRVGREGIVTFPNFGHWRCRLQVAWKGRMPVSETLPEAVVQHPQHPSVHRTGFRDPVSGSRLSDTQSASGGFAASWQLVHAFRAQSAGRNRPLQPDRHEGRAASLK